MTHCAQKQSVVPQSIRSRESERYLAICRPPLQSVFTISSGGEAGQHREGSLKRVPPYPIPYHNQHKPATERKKNLDLKIAPVCENQPRGAERREGGREGGHRQVAKPIKALAAGRCAV